MTPTELQWTRVFLINRKNLVDINDELDMLAMANPSSPNIKRIRSIIDNLKCAEIDSTDDEVKKMKCDDNCHYKDSEYIGLRCCYHGKVLSLAQRLKIMAYGCCHYRKERL